MKGLGAESREIRDEVRESLLKVLSLVSNCFATIERMCKATESHQWLIYDVQTGIATE